MDNEDKKQDFKDMVNTIVKVNKPWIIFCGMLLAALVLTNAIWGFVHWKQLKYAYMTPTDVSQEQQFDQHAQNQKYTSGVTNGD